MRRKVAMGCCAVASLFLASGRLDASHPVFAYDLVLVPEFSTLTVTGGFAGVHQEYRVDGRLGLTLDQHPHPPDISNAQFGLVEATLHGDGFFDREDLDGFLAMTQWQGVLIEDDLLSFTGVDGQDAPVTAIAELDGSWMRLRGSNLPGCCDFFNYSWDLLALNMLTEHGHAHADFNEDGDVDGNDLARALVNFGMDSGATHALGDADADRDVDRLDLTIWRSSAAGGSALHFGSTGAVPEPTSLSMVAAIAALSLWGIARRRGRAN
jgi:hypothetical protein